MGELRQLDRRTADTSVWVDKRQSDRRTAAGGHVRASHRATNPLEPKQALATSAINKLVDAQN